MQITLEDLMNPEAPLIERLKSLYYDGQSLHFVNEWGQQLKIYYAKGGSVIDRKEVNYIARISEFDIKGPNDLMSFSGTIWTRDFSWLERVHKRFMAGKYQPNYDCFVNMALSKNKNYVLRNV